MLASEVVETEARQSGKKFFGEPETIEAAAMPRIGSTMLAFPGFTGTTKRLVLANLAVFFLALIGGRVPVIAPFLGALPLEPALVVSHGFVWQLVTYSFFHTGLLQILFNMLSLWFIGSYLESEKGSRWLTEIFFASVIGGAVIGTLLSYTGLLHLSPQDVTSGASSGIFGMLVAFGVFFGDQQFMLFPFPIGIKAKYLVIVYLLIAIAMLVGGASPLTYAVYLSGALIGYLYAKTAPRRGFSFTASEQYFGWRNSYYKWKRRRAAKKFEVYMKKHDRTVRFDGEGRYIDPDEKRDPNDRRWMN
jgi:membrane associated rhomboid family serine protease